MNMNESVFFHVLHDNPERRAIQIKAMAHGFGDAPCSAGQRDLYEIGPDDEAVADFSSQGLSIIPEIVNGPNICALYIQKNSVEEIPYNLFTMMPRLTWLDLRDNKITHIPESIRFHPSLCHLLLQNNKLVSLPNELGTLNLKTLQLSGNPLSYPPKHIISEGVKVILKYLRAKFEEKSSFDVISDNSELFVNSDTVEYIPAKKQSLTKSKTISVRVSDTEMNYEEARAYVRSEGKCPKLAKSRQVLPSYCQSKKYLKPLRAAGKDEHTAKMRQCFLRDLAQKKYTQMLELREKIIQDRKNMNYLKDWRQNYRQTQYVHSKCDSSYKFDPKSLPFDTDPDHMVLLSREDIEKDLPDKYRKRLVRRSKVTMPRCSRDMELANKIKQLFDNLEKINLNRDSITPRTEQKMLMNEIHKISEIKQKLTQLSSVNFKNTAD